MAPVTASAVIALTLFLLPFQYAVLKLAPHRGGAIPHFYHRAACFILGIRRVDVGALATQRPLLLLANHVSWLDIVVLSAAMPVSFVAKSEVGAWPGIGFLARLQRTIFVDRARRTATRGTARDIAARLNAGDAMVLFAEGTSSDHNRVLPFRSALIGAAREALSLEGAEGGSAEVFVQPVSIAYPRRHGLPVLRRERPDIAWYGGMTLPNHLWNIMKFGGPEAVVSFGRPMAVTAETDRKDIARRAEAEVRAMTLRALRGEAPSAPAEPSGELAILLEAQTG
ncbi:1-acyl-sn-glycerol-3-phosphate acyltransferase [Terrihabitans soli]|uniref:1-acyl-sn-glycerol-3-phosphate acyltransferase n=1 Tax=Terrihabitans soli TaxID=708113 RepID=A0A6S6QGP2_9HYPH|nr:lysophospholipid acyltransferase family protein [Terrihabitans soli]BCJ89294.1 1-acyl-sn-glycerol-3-phosphate acyltransferase [Terrihabitans soli]